MELCLLAVEHLGMAFNRPVAQPDMVDCLPVDQMDQA
jgi:hypothetical protein